MTYVRPNPNDRGNDLSPTDATVIIGNLTTGVENLESGKQPLDPDLTAIAALGTTSYGRSLLTVADATEGRTLLDAAPSSVVASLAAKADLASPALTGNPTAPTASASDNDTTIATTAFVTGADTTLAATLNGSLAAKANIASPTLTGVPAAPTPVVADNSTTLATTAFVGLRARVTHPLTDDVLVEVWDVANARWQNVHYDSGWRTITPENSWTGTFRVRRVNSFVQVWIGGGISGAAKTSDAFWTIPVGFRNGNAGANDIVAASTHDQFFQAFKLNSLNTMDSTKTTTTYANFTYQCQATLPAALPGALFSAAPFV